MRKWEFCPDAFRIGFLIGILPTIAILIVNYNPILLLVPSHWSVQIRFGTWQFAVLVPAIAVFSATRRPAIVKGLCAAGIISIALDLFVRVGGWTQS